MARAKKQITLSELRVGLFVLGAIILLIFLILNASGDINPFAKKLYLKAHFANADGLRRGSDVRLAGVRVGKVEDVKLLPPSADPAAPKVEATMAVDDAIDGRPARELIRTDSTAQLGSPSLLGNEKLINITPGSAAGQPVPDDFRLPASRSDTFADLTASGHDLMQRLGRVSDQVNEIVRKVNEGEGSLGRLVNDEALYNNVNATIREAESVMAQIRSGRGSAGRFIYDDALYANANEIAANLRSMSLEIRAGRGTIGRFYRDEAFYNNANAAVARMNNAVEKIDSMLADVRAGRGTLGKLVTDEAIYEDARTAIARFNTTAERIDNIVASAQRGEGTLGKFVADEQLYNNVNQLSSEAVKLLYDFRQNPRRYLTVRFSLF